MADPVRPIQLVGNPAALPPDLAAKAQQAALVQQLATALMGQSITQESPIVRTGGSNPFAVDVPNLAPLGKLAQAYYGRQMMDDTSGTMAQIAAIGEAIRQQGIQKATAPQVSIEPVTRSPGEGYDVNVKEPTARDIAMALISSSHPANQALGGEWAKAGIDTEKSKAATGRDIASLLQHADPAAFAQMFQKGVWTGLPILTNPEEAVRLPNEHVKPRGSAVYRTDPTARGAAIESGMPVQGKVPLGTVVPAEEPKILAPYSKDNPTSKPAAISASGAVDLQETPETKSAAAAGEGWNTTLKENATKLRAAITELPNFVQAAELMNRAKFGITTEWRMGFLRLAKDLGFKTSDNDLGTIQAAQSAVARMMPLAAVQSHEFSPRAAQQLINQAQEATGANPKVDPNHVIDVAGAMVADIMNKTNQHNNEMVPKGRQSALGEAANTHLVDLPAIVPSKGMPWKFEKDPATGMIVNKGLTTPRGPAFSMRRKVVGGVTYIETAPGEWGVVQGEGK